MRLANVLGEKLPLGIRVSNWMAPLGLGIETWLARQCRRHCPVDGRKQEVAAVIGIRDGEERVFTGIPFYYSMPDARPGAVASALTASVAAGYREIVAAGYYVRGAASGRPLFAGDMLELIAEHRAGLNRPGPVVPHDSMLVEVWDTTEETTRLSTRLPHPCGGFTKRRPKPPIGFDCVQPMPRMLWPTRNFRRDIQLGIMPKKFFDWAKAQLQAVMVNSRADGVTRPCRKVHSAALVSADRKYVAFGVNTPSDVLTVNCCSERCAARNAFSAGIEHFAAAVIYSSEYPKGGGLQMCEFCQHVMAHHVSPDLGNMLVVYAENDHQPHRDWLSNICPHPYAWSEGRGTPFVSPQGTPGIFL